MQLVLGRIFDLILELLGDIVSVSNVPYSCERFLAGKTAGKG